MKEQNASVLKWINKSDDHLNNLDRFVKSLKYVI